MKLSQSFRHLYMTTAFVFGTILIIWAIPSHFLILAYIGLSVLMSTLPVSYGLPFSHVGGSMDEGHDPDGSKTVKWLIWYTIGVTILGLIIFTFML